MSTKMPVDGANPNHDNMTTLAFDQWAYSLNFTQTGCYTQGSLPVALATNDTCMSGFFCPNSTSQRPPQMCPPSRECAARRAGGLPCPDAQGELEPMLCNPGSYCPLGGKEMLECPKGTFCPRGTVDPISCDLGAYCPPSSAHQIPLLPLWVMIAIDFCLVCLLVAGLAFSKWRKKRPQYSTVSMDVTADDVELLRRVDRSSIYSPSPMPSPSPTESSFPPSTHLKPITRARSTSVASQVTDLDKLHQEPEMQKFLIYLSRAIHTKEVGLSFDFEDISFETKQGQQILKGITGCISRGSMWGVMGGSGAGKSTFVNALMKGKASGGSIKINGWSKDMKRYKKLVGYVPQDDIVLPELTVRENVLHSARMRLPSSWNDKAIQDYVDSLIACLALSHVRNSLVGDARKPVVSGGQRKRVSIAMELAAAPMAIFLDEPTSGLDATSAASIMRLLKAISQLGVTVISIIHQPREDIFMGFDQLLLLAQGRQVYAGKTDEVVSYFEDLGFQFPMRSNPADIVMDIITGDGGQYTDGKEEVRNVDALIGCWNNKGQYDVQNRHLSVNMDSSRSRRWSAQSFQSSADQEQSLHLTMKARGASWYAQVYYCCKRALLQQVRNRTSFFFEIGVAAVAGLVIGLSSFASKGNLFHGIYHPPFDVLSSAVNYTSAPQLGLLSAMAIGLAASAPGVAVFGEEKMIFKRESASGHSRSAYYLGKVVSTIPRIVLASLHYTVLISVLATPLMRFSDMYIANMVYFYVIYGLASVVSMVVKREDGPLLAVLVSLVLGVLSGVAPLLSKVEQWHLLWLWQLSPAMYFAESYWTRMIMPTQHLYMVDAATEATGYTLERFGLDLGAILLIGTVYRLIAYVLLILPRRK